MKIWAIVGESAQNIQETQPSADNILMATLRPQGNYVAAVDGTWIEAEPTPQELKLIGVEFEGVMCSATSEDQAGLSWVLPYIKDGKEMPQFKFQNDNSLLITHDNVAEFEAVWLPFREGFFE